MKILTLNIRKGHTLISRKRVIHHLKNALQSIPADIIFLQEVIGGQFIPDNEPELPEHVQHTFLAEQLFDHAHYSQANTSSLGHHGNAILSKFHLKSATTLDVSGHKWDPRNILHCTIELPNDSETCHLICVHLGLFARWRHSQFNDLYTYITEKIPPEAPLIIGGDFNDWQIHAPERLETQLELVEAVKAHTGIEARTYPAVTPIFRLDRIYTRHFLVTDTRIYSGRKWSKFTDHAGVWAQLSRC